MARKGTCQSLKGRQKQSETLRRKHLEKLEEFKDKLKNLLEKDGPMGLFVAKKKIGLTSRHTSASWMREVITNSSDLFRHATVSVGPTGANRANFTSYKLFDGLSVAHMGPIIYLKGDDRIVSFVGSRIMVPKTSGEVCALSYRLNRIFGKELARKMIESTGYQYYKHPPHISVK